MKPSTLLLAFLSVAAFTGCSTAYKTGQTPDDVYYSAAKPQVENNEDKNKDEERYTSNDEYYDDRYLRMKVRNRHRWSELDEWYYYDKYSTGYSYYYGSYNNPYTSWNYFYNPYCCCHYTYYPIGGIKYNAAPPVVKRPFNLGGYTNTNYNSGGSYKAPTIKTSSRTYNNTNSNNYSDKKTIYTKDSKDNSGSSRTYTPSTSSGSGNTGGSGSGGGSAPVTRPVRK